MSDKEISEGDKVQWNYGSTGHPKGIVTEIQTEPNSKLQIQTKKGNTITRKGDEKNPAVKVDRKGEEGFGQDVVKKMSELTKVDEDENEKDDGKKDDELNGEEEIKDLRMKGDYDEGGGEEDKGKKELKVGDKRPLPSEGGNSGKLGESKGDSSSVKSCDQMVDGEEDEGESKEQVVKEGSDKDKQDDSEVKEPETKKPKLDSEHKTTSITTENSKPTGRGRGRGRGRARAKTTASTTGNRRSTRGKKDNDVDKDKPVEESAVSNVVEEVTMNDFTGPEESGSVEQGADIPVEEAPAGNTRSQK